MCYLVPSLTYDVEVHKHGHLGLGGNLTLVGPGIPLLHVLNHQRPGVRLGGEVNGEPLVAHKGVLVHREDVRATLPHPRHLDTEIKTEVDSEKDGKVNRNVDEIKP